MTETMEVFLQMTTWRDADMFVETNVLKNKDIIFKKREKIKENINHKKTASCYQKRTTEIYGSIKKERVL